MRFWILLPHNLRFSYKLVSPNISGSCASGVIIFCSIICATNGSSIELSNTSVGTCGWSWRWAVRSTEIEKILFYSFTFLNKVTSLLTTPNITPLMLIMFIESFYLNGLLDVGSQARKFARARLITEHQLSLSSLVSALSRCFKIVMPFFRSCNTKKH